MTTSAAANFGYWARLTNAVKFFSSTGSITLLADREWLDGGDENLQLILAQKNAHRLGLTSEKQADVAVTAR